MMQESADKRTSESQSLSQKASMKAEAEDELEAHKEAKATSSKELMVTMKYISSLHAECDWLMQYFDARKAARAGEVESLKQAKAVLSGADYALLQQRTYSFLG